MDKTIPHDASEPDWRRIERELAEPFDPADVDFRQQGKALPNTNVQLLAYIDARTVQDRLDAVLGIEHWTYDWTPIGIDSKGEIVSVKATLTIHGISKSDVGSASNIEGDKGAVSGGLKRAAVQWGIGRYLYDLPTSWQKADEHGRIPPAAITALRSRLPAPKMEKESPALPEPTPIRKHKTEAALEEQQPAEQHIPIEPTEKDWQTLKARIFKAKLATTVAAFEKLMEQTGGSYEDVLVKVEAAEQHNLREVPLLDGRKRNH
jgi:hypothetical protein